jgi:hypothetical protein
MVFTCGLLIYHVTLVCRNITTKEELKNTFRNQIGNPYRKTCGVNIKKVLCPRLSQPDLLKKIQMKIQQKEKAVKIIKFI